MTAVIVGGVLTVVLAALVVVLAVIPRYTKRKLRGQGGSAYEELAATTELRRVVVEATVAFLVLVGAITAFNEYRATKERQDSERFAQMVELLGSTNVPAQIGAVYGMEGVARSDPSYYPTVDDTLSALIRSRIPYGDANSTATPPGTPPAASPTASPAASPTPPAANRSTVDPVVQAAIRVLGRVPNRPDRRLDLSRSDLRNIDLLAGDFRNASFEESNLFDVQADGADLRGANFTGAVVGSEVCGARLGNNAGLPAGGC